MNIINLEGKCYIDNCIVYIVKIVDVDFNYQTNQKNISVLLGINTNICDHLLQSAIANAFI